MTLFKSLCCGLLASTVAVVADAHAEKRVALVIGNSNYAHVRALPNPERDATAIAALFRSAGFDVVEAQNNMGSGAMRRAFRNFSDTATNADIAVVYYAGHGIEVGGANYLLPIDAVLERDLDVEDEAISVERIVRALEPAKRLRLVILDACRDNPFVRTMKRTVATRSLGRGLARVEPQSSNTLIAFAAKEGSTAEDGDSMHSPFTDALLKNITTPGLDLRLAFGRVRDEVLKATNNRQEPFLYGSLGGATVSLVPPEKPATAVARPTPAGQPPAVVDANAVARGDYEFASKVGSIEIWNAFLVQHPTGFYAELAKAQRDRLAAAKTDTPKTDTPAPGTQKTAAVQPAAAPEVRKPMLDPADAAHRIHKELARLGCYSGDVNNAWGKASRQAVESVNRRAGTRLDARAPSQDTLDALRDRDDRVCPEVKTRDDSASRRERERDKRDDSASRRERERDKRDTQRQRDRRETQYGQRANQRPKAQASSGGAAKVICGGNGCINIRPGCRGEVRPSGHGDWAVELCN